MLLVCVALVAPHAGAQTDDPRPGLVAEYRAEGCEVRRVTASPHLLLEPEESAHPCLSAGFAVRWRGMLSVLQASHYQFFCNGCEIEIAGRPAVGQRIELVSGRHPIEIRYQRRAGAARLRVDWEAEHFAREPLPSSVLAHAAEQAPAEEDELVEEGRYWFEEYGCGNCHRPQAGSLRTPPGPPLTAIGSSIHEPWFYSWLRSPQEVFPGARMPVLLDEPQRRDVAAYLASLRDRARQTSGGQPSEQQVERGRALFQSIGCAACHQQAALRLDGLGSKSDAFVWREFLREPSRRRPAGRMPSLLLSPQEALEIGAYLADSTRPELEQAAPAGDPRRGKALVESSGCLACHELTGGGERLRNGLRAPALGELHAAEGCLSDAPPPGVAKYAFRGRQRAALRAFVKAWRRTPDISPAPLHELERDIRRFGCRNCHEFEHEGPYASLAQTAPVLTGVGAKLKTSWLEGVIHGTNRSLTWLDLRMPQYDKQAARGLAVKLAKAAGASPGEGEAGPAADRQLARAGHGMLGADASRGGLGCIGCHDWGERRALGEPGPQLRDAAERLRYAWFVRWMRDPARILSGTSMPNYFAALPSAEAQQKIDALWLALRAAGVFPLPAGFETKSTEAGGEARPLPAEGRAAVVRWDMPEATPSAIAVGLPGGVSYCFDAGEARLRYAWSGGFVDLTRTLYQKRNKETGLTETAAIVGEIFYRTRGFPFRMGSRDEIPVVRFRGYRLVDGFPEFHYELQGVPVREWVEPLEAGEGLRRHFRLGERPRPVWFLLDHSGEVTIEVQGAATREGAVELPAGAPREFAVTLRK